MKKGLLLGLVMLSAFIAFGKKTTIVIKTNYGNMEMELYDRTPLHKKNMIKLAKEHYFDSTLFHRVIPGFVIQGGDPKSKTAKPEEQLGNGELGYRIPAEIDSAYFHRKGAVGMARDMRPDKASSGCQFYIVVGKKFQDNELDMIEQRTGKKMSAEEREIYKTEGGTPHLDGGYTVFGILTKGIDIAEKIANVSRNAQDRPKDDVRMLSVRVKKRFLFF